MAETLASRGLRGGVKTNILSKLIKILKRKNYIQIKTNNEYRKVKKIKGLKLVFRGTNNKVTIGKNCKFQNSKIEFWGDNTTVEIGDNGTFYNLYSIMVGKKYNSTLKIGNNFFVTDNLKIYNGYDITIGDGCMFSRDITIYSNDGHDIFDNETGEVINKPKRPVQIGDKVWLGHGVTILKNTSLPNNTIVGARSVIAKEFTEENTIIAGNNPRVVRKNISWKQ